MKRLVLALLAAAILQPVLTWSTDAQGSEAKYQALLAAAKADPAAADWQALRFAFAGRPSFSPYGDPGGRKAMREAAKAGDWKATLTAANKLLDGNYVDAEAHTVASAAYAKLGRPDEAKREQATAVAIYKSIMRGGDGKSPEQAFVVISVAEEYALMRVLRYRVVRQSLIQADKHAYDRLEVTGPEGNSATFYFQVDRVLATQSRLLGLKLKKQE